MWSPEKDYCIRHPAGLEELMSEDELWNWYILVRPDEISWFDLKEKIRDKGAVSFSNGSIVSLVTHRKNVQTKTDTQTNSCRHTDTFVNHAGGTEFLQCKKCKADLGDIKVKGVVG